MLVVLSFLSYIWSLPSILHENTDDEWMNEYWALVELHSQRKNLSTQRKLRPSATLSTINPTWTGLGLRLGISGDKLATNHLSCRNSQIPWYRCLLVLTLFGNVVEINNVTSKHCYQNYAKLVVELSLVLKNTKKGMGKGFFQCSGYIQQYQPSTVICG
jgi:hypothetical protein